MSPFVHQGILEERAIFIASLLAYGSKPIEVK